MTTFVKCIRLYCRWSHRRPSKVIMPRHMRVSTEAETLAEDAEHVKYKTESINNRSKSYLNTDSSVEKPSLLNTVQMQDLVKEQTHRNWQNSKTYVPEYVEHDMDQNDLEIRTDQKSGYDHKDSSVKENVDRSKPKRPNKKPVAVTKPKVKSPKIIDAATGLQIVKLQLGDPKISNLMLAVKSRKRREQTQQILLEGKRLVRDALQAGLKLEALLFTKTEHLQYLQEWLTPDKNETKSDKESVLYKIPNSDMTLWSDLVTTPGLMGLFTRPPSHYSRPNDDGSTETRSLPITVVCDNIREPSNLGAVIRTCAAIPCHQLILTKGCCDPWDSKVLRGGAGGHFRLSLHSGVAWDMLHMQLPDQFTVFIADSNPEARITNLPLMRYYEPQYVQGFETNMEHVVIVMGGETHGVSSEAYTLCKAYNGSRVNIPLARDVDSLNIATALSIVAFEIKRQMLLKCST